MSNPIKYYEVGGCIRDKILGLVPKDIDYSVEAPSYEDMGKDILRRGGTIFPVSTNSEKNFTIKAKIPGLGVADFVLCRKEGPYSDGRHPDWVKPGTLMDDLARRDFRMNAIAVGEDGVEYDPHLGREDIKYALIQCVGDSEQRMREDALRLLRAIRFAITKDFVIAPEVEACLVKNDIIQRLDLIALDRIRDEMFKAFKHNTRKSLHMLTHVYPGLGAKVFSYPKLQLIPTLNHSL